MSGFGQCPRCGTWSVEYLRSHSHCWECSYNPEVSRWHALEYKKHRTKNPHLFGEVHGTRGFALAKGVT